MSINPAKDAISWPQQQQDTVILAQTINIGFSNSLGTGSFNIDTSVYGLHGPGLPVANYSLDNAPTTWYEAYDINNNTAPLKINVKVADSGTSIRVEWAINPLVPGYGAGASIQVALKVCILALPVSTLVTGPVQGAQVISYTSSHNYTKLFNQGEVNKIPSGTVNVPYNLGTASTFKLWDHSGGFYFPAFQAGFNGGGLMIDTAGNNLSLSALSVDTGSWVWRVYYDS